MHRRTAVLAVVAGLAAVAGLGCSGSQSTSRAAVDLVVEDVTLIDGTGAPPRPHASLVIDDGRIVAIVDSGGAVPRATTRIEGRGRFAIPGLFDAHVHLGMGGLEPRDEGTSTRVLRQFLFYGVTSVLSVGGSGSSDEEIAKLRDAQPHGNVPGARVFAAGSLLTPPGSHPVSTIFADIPGSAAPGFDWSPYGVTLVATPADGTAAVERKAALDLDAVKVIVEDGPSPFGTDHPMLPRELLETVVAAATEHGLPVLAHTTDADEMRVAIDGGARALMHLAAEHPYPDDALAAHMAAREVVQVATLSLFDGFHRFLDDPAAYDDPFLRAGVAASTLASLRDAKGFHAAHAPAADLVRREGAERRATVQRLRKAGVAFALGTDSNNPWSFPGYGAHRELELLVDAGMTPLEALATSREGARLVGQGDHLGSIEVGKRADVLLLASDPSKDIRATRTLEVVIQDGAVIDREALLPRAPPR